MSKIIKKIKTNHSLEWGYSMVEIKQMREDLDALEKLGATHVEINAACSYGDTILEIDVYTQRLETDEEYKVRIGLEAKKQEEVKRRELQYLSELKAKYERGLI